MKEENKQRQVFELGRYVCKVCEMFSVDEEGDFCCSVWKNPHICTKCRGLGEALFYAGARIPVSDDPIYNSWLNFATFVNESEKGNR